MPQHAALTNHDLLQAERELCRRSLAAFAKRAWHVLEPATPLKWGWALDAICMHLEAVTDGRIKRLLINVPPGCMKSLLTSVIWPAWEWGARGLPHLRIIGTAHEETLAIRDSRKCRELIRSEWYQKLWPVTLLGDLDGKKEFGNSRQGVRSACAFTSLTGRRGDRVILDDPISAANANSAAELENVKTTFLETLPTRVNNEDSAIIVIMQRLNEKDVSGVILSMGLPYVHICIPMRYEPERRCTTAIGWTDPRTKAGELMFPERFAEDQVSELERTLGSYGAAGQLQQRPTPRGGGLLKLQWLKYWSVLPLIEWRIIVADTAQKTGQDNDYSVLQCWGRSFDGLAVLIDQVRGKWESPELITRTRAFWHKHQSDDTHQVKNAPLRALYVEDKVSGTGLAQTIRRDGIPVMPMQRNRDKISRAHDAAPFVESGNLLLPHDAPWLSDLLGEIESFPSGSHDDQLDPLMDAVMLVQRLPKSITHQAGNVRVMPVANKWR